MLLCSLISRAVGNGICVLPVHRVGRSLSPAQIYLSRCAQWCGNLRGAHICRYPQAPDAFEAEQGLGLSCVAHASGSSANMLYTTTKIWDPNFYLLHFLVANVAMGAF